MECRNCQLFQRKFYCHNCIKIHIRDQRAAIEQVAKEASKNVKHAAKELSSMENARQTRAEIAGLEERVAETQLETQNSREKNVATSERIAKLKASVTERRRNLAAAQSLPLPSHSKTSQALQTKVTRLSDELSEARRVFVEELLDVFDVVEVGGRPAMGGIKGTKGEWMIGGMVLPVPGDMTRYPPEHINAAITYTMHFINLLTFYLGVKLPFEVTWSESVVGVGTPYMAAGKGPDTGGWARWISKQPLHMPTSTSPSTSSTPSTSPTKTSSSQAPSFTIGITMLIYNIIYLCHTQSLSIPLSQSGEILRNLWELCCCPQLGRRSHQTDVGVPLETPTPVSFTLEFAQLLQVTSAGPVHKKKRRLNPSKPLRDPMFDEEEGDWDLIEAES
ncbi:hypothetical protein M422DRAFT_24884 [Sphaerobolus stellatus SS14]|nr:hypothetical protein M422DRAFT_24884 [Sphaerobolus stellatus SS14]